VTSLFIYCLCVCVCVSLVAYFYYTTPNVGVLYIYNNNNNNNSACVHSLPQDYYLNYAWMQAMISVLAETYSINWDSAKAHYDKKSMIS